MIWNERMKKLRKDNNLTLKEVAKKLCVSEATVQRYESDKIKNIPYEVIVKYADVFDCSPSYIMGWDSAMEQVDQTLLKKEIDKMDSKRLDLLLSYAIFLNTENGIPKSKKKRRVNRENRNPINARRRFV